MFSLKHVKLNSLRIKLFFTKMESLVYYIDIYTGNLNKEYPVLSVDISGDVFSKCYLHNFNYVISFLWKHIAISKSFLKKMFCFCLQWIQNAFAFWLLFSDDLSLFSSASHTCKLWAKNRLLIYVHNSSEYTYCSSSLQMFLIQNIINNFCKNITINDCFYKFKYFLLKVNNYYFKWPSAK